MRRPRDLVLAAAAGPAVAAAALAGRRGARARVASRVARATARTREETRAQVLAEAAALAPTPEQHRENMLVELLAERPAPAGHLPAPLASGPLVDRLSAEDLTALEQALEGEQRATWEAADPAMRRWLTLIYIAHYRQEAALERTAMLAAMPEEDVHAMARGALASGGDPWLADLVLDAVAAAGLELPPDGTILDFGSSSGRVLRVIAAARADLRCLGCDPNAGAIAWAAKHLAARAEFFVSPQAPPLDLPDGSLDLAYAVSVWSHFAEAPALAWFEEMHRVLRPGAPLVITTHGFDCLSEQLRREAIGRQTAAAAAAAMVRHGHFFVDVFGPAGDWGVQDPGWGNAYLTLDWLQSRLDGRFTTRLLWPGAIDAVQDVVVLERR